jgi:sulfur carrier protein ThiS
MLKRYAPEQAAADHPFQIEVPDKATIADLIAQLGIPEREVKVAYVNNLARAVQFRLAPDAEVGIFPPIGGG